MGKTDNNNSHQSVTRSDAFHVVDSGILGFDNCIAQLIK